MKYNTQLDKLIIPEYGRNIQNMIEYCCTIEDREERNKCAKAIIQVMGQLNPHLRDVADFTHKLWVHLFIISKFKLDVDSPYPLPSPEKLETKPEIVKYPHGKIKYKHYGKTIEEIIEKAKAYPEGPEKEELKLIIANHLKKSYITWNKDGIGDEVILKHMEELSKGDLKMEAGIVLHSGTEFVKRFNSNTNNNGHKKHNNNNNHKRNNWNNNFKRNNNNNNNNSKY
jgi:hypothetical protein